MRPQAGRYTFDRTPANIHDFGIIDRMQSFTWRELLIGSIVALTFYVAVELLVFLRASRKKTIPRPIPEVRHEKSALESMKEELTELRIHVTLMQKEIDRLRDENDAPAPYAQAIRMVRQGMGPAEIAVACDISKGEAELIASLHKSRGG